MSRVICIGSLKGGVGKTTTAVCLSVALSIAEKKVLLVDTDPQGQATVGIGPARKDIQMNLYHGLMGKVALESIILNSFSEWLNIIPSGIELIELEDKPMSNDEREKLLKNLLNSAREQYDYIIIDCPPSFGLITKNAFAAADSFLIPLQCEYYSFEGLGQLIRMYQMLKKNVNPKIEIEGILLTMFSPDEKISQQIAKNAQSHFKNLVFKTIIPRDTQLKEAACFNKPLAFRDIKSVGANRYLDLANEIMS